MCFYDDCFPAFYVCTKVENTRFSATSRPGTATTPYYTSWYTRAVRRARGLYTCYGIIIIKYYDDVRRAAARGNKLKCSRHSPREMPSWTVVIPSRVSAPYVHGGQLPVSLTQTIVQSVSILGRYVRIQYVYIGTAVQPPFQLLLARPTVVAAICATPPPT